MTKMGLKRDPTIKRTRLKRVSKKQAKENSQLSELTNRLRILCNFRSELTGIVDVMLDPHHLAGRGKNLLNPFTIIMITRGEHEYEQKHMSYKHKQELIKKIRPIRIAQGYKETDYD